eukprot:355373_1
MGAKEINYRLDYDYVGNEDEIDELADIFHSYVYKAGTGTPLLDHIPAGFLVTLDKYIDLGNLDDPVAYKLETDVDIDTGLLEEVKRLCSDIAFHPTFDGKHAFAYCLSSSSNGDGQNEKYWMYKIINEY